MSDVCRMQGTDRLYLYAITGPDGDHGRLARGLRDAPVYALPYRDLRAIVSPIPDGAIAAAEPDALRHEQVVEHLMAQGPALPVRFGTLLADDERVRALLASRHAEFASALGRVAGKVEMGVRVLWDRPPDGGACSEAEGERDHGGPGFHYLMARLDEHRRETASRAHAERLADGLDSALAVHAAEACRSLLLTPNLPVNTAYLVPRENVADFCAAVERQRARLPGCRLLCSGPWPPYHFVGPAGGE